MNKEFISIKKISDETSKEMVAVVNENGNLEFRESVNNLQEILEAENLKERIKELLKAHKDKKEQITESNKTKKSIRYKVDNILPSILLIIVMLMIRNTCDLNAVLEQKIYNFILSLGCWGGVGTALASVIYLVRENIYLKRKEITINASITLLEHLLDKTNKKLEKLKNESVLVENISLDKTIVDTKELNELDEKMILIDTCATNPNCVQFLPSGKVYNINNGIDKARSFELDEEEKKVIYFCHRECSKLTRGKSKVLRKII